MTLWQFLGGAATVAASAALGWMLNAGLSDAAVGTTADRQGPDGSRAAVSPPPVPESTPAFSVFRYPGRTDPSSASPEPASPQKSTVTLHGDGTVTINVHKRPWHSVLEEVARQENARTPAAGPASAQAAKDLAAAVAATEAGQKEVLQALRNGDETSRYEALLNARTNGAVVPDDTLRQLFEIDASERVRRLAFENYLERKSGSAEEVRSAAQAALYASSPSIQAEARKILEQLDEQERGKADDPQAGAGGS